MPDPAAPIDADRHHVDAGTAELQEVVAARDPERRTQAL